MVSISWQDWLGQHFPVVTDFLCMMQAVPKKQVVAKAPVKVAAAPTQESSSSEDSSSEEDEEQEQKKPVKKKPGDRTWGVRLHDCYQGPVARRPLVTMGTSP